MPLVQQHASEMPRGLVWRWRQQDEPHLGRCCFGQAAPLLSAAFERRPIRSPVNGMWLLRRSMLYVRVAYV
eukprot:6187630-Pleurochrysis_carterae.AAC.1